MKDNLDQQIVEGSKSWKDLAVRERPLPKFSVASRAGSMSFVPSNTPNRSASSDHEKNWHVHLTYPVLTCPVFASRDLA